MCLLKKIFGGKRNYPWTWNSPLTVRINLLCKLMSFAWILAENCWLNITKIFSNFPTKISTRVVLISVNNADKNRLGYSYDDFRNYFGDFLTLRGKKSRLLLEPSWTRDTQNDMAEKSTHADMEENWGKIGSCFRGRKKCRDSFKNWSETFSTESWGKQRVERIKIWD